MDAQSIFALHVNIATNMEYRLAVTPGQQLNVRVLHMATDQATQLTLKFSNIVPTMALGEYAQVPATYKLVQVPTEQRQTKRDHSDQNPVTPDKVKETNRKRARNDGPPNPPTTDNSNRGLFEYNGTAARNIPVPDTFFKHATPGHIVKLCRKWSYLNLSCHHGPYGKTCPFFHLKNKGALRPADLTAISAWVTATPHVRWNAQRT